MKSTYCNLKSDFKKVSFFNVIFVIPVNFLVMSEILDNYYANNQNIGDGSTAGEKVRQFGPKFEQKDRMGLVTSWEEIPAY